MSNIEAIEILKQMKLELQDKIEALDKSIRLLSGNTTVLTFDPIVAEDEPEETKECETPVFGKTKNTKFEMSVDLSDLHEPLSPWNCHKCDTYNPSTATVCLKCKAPRPNSSR